MKFVWIIIEHFPQDAPQFFVFMFSVFSFAGYNFNNAILNFVLSTVKYLNILQIEDWYGFLLW